jgi:chromosome segregation ATPase
MIDQPTIANATTPATIAFNTERKTGESEHDYANRLAESIHTLAQQHAKALTELDYQRRCHEACHKEVQRLRQVLAGLRESMVNANSTMSNEALLKLCRKVAGKFNRYLGLVQQMHQKLEAETQAAMNSPNIKNTGFAKAIQILSDDVKTLKADIKSGRDTIASTTFSFTMSFHLITVCRYQTQPRQRRYEDPSRR